MVFKVRLPAENRAYARYLRTAGDLSFREIAKLCKMSPSSVKRCTDSCLPRTVGRGNTLRTRQTTGRGRPTKISVRTERYLVRELRKLRSLEGTFSVSRLMSVTGISQADVSIRTVCNVLHTNGYGFYQARKKGLLTPEDFKLRVKFAKRMLRRPDDFWCKDVAFYLDGVSFVYKTNPNDQARAPKSRVYRKRSEGLSRCCTAKGRKEGTGGKYAKFIVAITAEKGVLVCEAYEKMNGQYFESFIDRNFEEMFRTSSKNSQLFLQDGDPSQNSAAARRAMARVRAQLLAIPPRSPDINAVENIFHLVSEQMKKDAIYNNLTKESFQQFQDRIIATIRAIPQRTIDNTIGSIPKRLRRIVETGGERTKY